MTPNSLRLPRSCACTNLAIHLSRPQSSVPSVLPNGVMACGAHTCCIRSGCSRRAAFLACRNSAGSGVSQKKRWHQSSRTIRWWTSSKSRTDETFKSIGLSDFEDESRPRRSGSPNDNRVRLGERRACDATRDNGGTDGASGEKRARKRDTLREIYRAMKWAINEAADAAVKLAQEKSPVAQGVVDPNIHFDVTILKDGLQRTGRYTLYFVMSCNIMTPEGTAVPASRIRKQNRNRKSMLRSPSRSSSLEFLRPDRVLRRKLIATRRRLTQASLAARSARIRTAFASGKGDIGKQIGKAFRLAPSAGANGRIASATMAVSTHPLRACSKNCVSSCRIKVLR